MGYQLPFYESLCDQIAKLLNDFNTLSRRYITPDLDLLFNNTQKEMEAYIKIGGDRVTQAKALLQLLLELKQDEHFVRAARNPHPSENDLKLIAATHQVMLGALIHRSLRIRDEYKPVKKTTTMFGAMGDYLAKKVYNPEPTNSDIYNAITGILNITQKNQLDSMTVKTSCELFKAYMLQGKRYLSYVHYKDDPNFESHLQGFVDKATKEAECVIPQIRQIQFLMSFAKNIQEIHRDLALLLENLEKRLTEKDLPLNLGIIQKHLDNINAEKEAKERFWLLMNREYVSDNIHQWPIIEFMKEMRECLQINSQYALFGGCFLILDQASEAKQVHLYDVLCRALKCDRRENQIDAETASYGLKSLKHWFMNINIKAATVDWSLLDGKDIGRDQFFAQYKRTKMKLKSTTTRAESSETKATI